METFGIISSIETIAFPKTIHIREFDKQQKAIKQAARAAKKAAATPAVETDISSPTLSELAHHGSPVSKKNVALVPAIEKIESIKCHARNSVLVSLRTLLAHDCNASVPSTSSCITVSASAVSYPSV